ncbi:MAG: DUF2269 family protein [Alphaproteobacteria bacterium]|nr:DUF2269 family protein [Alphaproteobacteria bacterium]
MRKFLKVMHTVASCGLIGGLACYMLLLVAAPQETPAEYASLRLGIAAISDYLLVPSLGLALFTGLISMAVHHPFQDKGWALLKAALGILMFKGVLTIVSAKAGYAADISQRIANGAAPADALQSLVSLEWQSLWVVMALAVANVVLGVWRPRFSSPAKVAARGAASNDPSIARAEAPPSDKRTSEGGPDRGAARPVAAE